MYSVNLPIAFHIRGARSKMHKRRLLQATWRARLHQASVTQSRAGYRACRLHCAELNPQPRSKPAEAMAQKMNFVST